MEFINLTPHAVDIFTGDGATVRIDPAGRPVRARVVTEDLGTVCINGAEVPLVAQRLGALMNLPAKQEGVRYIVSNKVAMACSRKDLVVPHGLVVDNGCVIGCRGLAVR